MVASYAALRAVSNVGDSLLSDQLEANLLAFFQYGLLGVGGFANVTVPASGWYGGDQHRLRPVSDPNYADGRVWEAFRKDWVWETGVPFPQQPVAVSGVWVDGTFRGPRDAGGYAHRVDYPNGRVVFDAPVAPRPGGPGVACEYSYRLFQFYTADCPWWQQLQLDSFRVDDSHFLQRGSGAWDVLAENRVQLPAVIVEAVPETTRYGYELGGETAVVNQAVLFHVFAEDRWQYKFLHDAIANQWNKTVQAFDKNKLLDADAYPLDADGSPRASGLLMYPALADPTGAFHWQPLVVRDVRSSAQPLLGSLRYCVVRATIQAYV